jgi:aldose 1-epimerase
MAGILLPSIIICDKGVPMTPLITLETGSLRASFLPEAGASLAAFEMQRDDAWIPLMRPTPPEAVDALNPSLMASFNLVPWSNRIAGARFTFGGRSHALRPNTPQGFAIHGDALRRPWRVVAQSRDAAACVIDTRDIADFNFPFPFSAEIRYALGADTFDTTLEIVNAGGSPMPAGFGFHPYFNRGFGAGSADEAQLQLTVSRVYQPMAGMAARRAPAPGAAPGQATAPVPPDMDFTSLAPVGARDIDHCFGGWDGRATIAYPSAGLSLAFECDPVFGHVIVYTPPGKPFFAVEPVTHANDGFNLLAAGEPGTGVRVLGPGERLSGRFRLRVRHAALH